MTLCERVAAYPQSANLTSLVPQPNTTQVTLRSGHVFLRQSARAPSSPFVAVRRVLLEGVEFQWGPEELMGALLVGTPEKSCVRLFAELTPFERGVIRHWAAQTIDEMQHCGWPLVRSDASDQWALSRPNWSFTYPVLGSMLPEPPVMVKDWRDYQPVCTWMDAELLKAREAAAELIWFSPAYSGCAYEPAFESGQCAHCGSYSNWGDDSDGGCNCGNGEC